MNRRAFLGLSSAAIAPANVAIENDNQPMPEFQYGDLVTFDRSNERPDSPVWRLLIKEHRDIALAKFKARSYQVTEIRRMPTTWKG